MAQKTTELWLSCQKYLRDNLGEDTYSLTFAHVELVTFIVATRTLELSAPSQDIVERIENDDTIFNFFRQAVLYTFGKIHVGWRIAYGKGKITFEGQGPAADEKSLEEIKNEEQEKTFIGIPGTTQQRLPEIASNLNTSQKFSNFIEGDSNRLSRSVGLRVAEHPQGTQFNPMFIYGPSGCGKTHLVNAIGNRCKKLYPTKRILYVNAQMFQQQFTSANLEGKFNDFISFYQTIDMLIVDDVQEWIKATKTQNAFFHIFNHLTLNGKRIILVCDRPPVELEEMNKRLLSRFKSGMMAEMEQPNVELCEDVLRSKIKRDGISVPEDVIKYIAQTANNSIRELGGIINSLVAYSVVYNCNIDMKLVERVVKRAVKTDNMPLTIDDILDIVCRNFDVTPMAVKGTSRKKEVVMPRQISMYLADKYTNIPSARIGKIIGGRDHSTVLYAIDKVAEKIKKDKSFAALVEKIDSMLKVKKS